MKLNRFPGFRYGPKLRIQPCNVATLYRVEQKGFWMDASIVGPTKPNEAEAIKAWNRLIKAKAAVECCMPNPSDNRAGEAGSGSSRCWAEHGQEGKP